MTQNAPFQKKDSKYVFSPKLRQNSRIAKSVSKGDEISAVMSATSTSNSSPATAVNYESQKEVVIPGEKIGNNEQELENETKCNTGVENSMCSYIEHDQLENEKNRNKDKDAANDSMMHDKSNNNSSEFSESLTEEKSKEYSRKQKHLLDQQVDTMQPIQSRKLVSLADIIHQISGQLTSDKTGSSKIADQDRVEQKVEQPKAENLKCQIGNTDLPVSENQQGGEGDISFERGVENNKLVSKSGEDEEMQNKIHDGSLDMECQKKTKVEEKEVTSSCNCEKKTDGTTCTTEMEVTQKTLVDQGQEKRVTTELELQPDQQLYSLDLIKSELANVKNALTEENQLEKGKDEKDSNSSDLEESSGTITSSTESDDEASSSSDDEEVVSRAVVAAMEEEEDRIHQTAPKTRDEISVIELPAEPELDIKLDEQMKLVEIGKVTSVVEILMVVKAIPSTPALDVDTVLFLEDRKALGKVFEIFGPVQSPYYAIRFNSEAEAKEKNITHGTKVFYCPDLTEFTKFVFTAQLRKIKGSDASWKFDQEPPEELVEYSDDEEESKAKAKKRHEKRTQNPGNKGNSNSGQSLGGQPSKQSKGSKEFIPGKKSRQARSLAQSSQKQHRPHLSEGFGLPPPGAGEFSQAAPPGAVFQPGRFSGPPPCGQIQGPQHVPHRQQFCPRPLQPFGPLGPSTEFQHFNPSFVIPPERPFGNRLPVQGVAIPQPPGQLGASSNGPPPNLLPHGGPPVRNFPRPFGNSIGAPMMQQGAFNRAPFALPHNRMRMGHQLDDRAALYLPPPPPPPPPPVSQPPNNPYIPPM